MTLQTNYLKNVWRNWRRSLQAIFEGIGKEIALLENLPWTFSKELSMTCMKKVLKQAKQNFPNKFPKKLPRKRITEEFMKKSYWKIISIAEEIHKRTLCTFLLEGFKELPTGLSFFCIFGGSDIAWHWNILNEARTEPLTSISGREPSTFVGGGK